MLGKRQLALMLANILTTLGLGEYMIIYTYGSNDQPTEERMILTNFRAKRLANYQVLIRKFWRLLFKPEVTSFIWKTSKIVNLFTGTILCKISTKINSPVCGAIGEIFMNSVNGIAEIQYTQLTDNIYNHLTKEIELEYMLPVKEEYLC